MARQDDHDRLSELEKRISALKTSEEERSGDHVRRAGMSGMGAGMRIAVELVAGLGVGVAIGIVLDRWLGTSPWLLIVFFILGSGAAFMNVYRIAKRMEKRAKEAREAAEREAADRKAGRTRD
ncbi:MAG: AtpZ/AtpI family protein [Alphaproteobacteria bacterium]